MTILPKVRNTAGGEYVVSTDADPASSLKTVTPHASNNLPDGACRALWVGTGGSVIVLAKDDASPVTIASVADGTLLPISAIAVRTGTTATNIVAMY